MPTFVKTSLTFLLFLGSFVSTIHADFFVIPVLKKMKNVVTVAKSGGQYTDVKKAIDAITDASALNPYLVYIGPGVYNVTETINLKPYVSVMGSGIDTTHLSGALESIVLGADNTTLSQMSITNSGGVSSAEVIANMSVSPTLIQLKLSVSGGTTRNYGVYNSNASPVIRDVAIEVSSDGFATSYGLYNSYGQPEIDHVAITLSSQDDSYGIRNYGAAAIMKHISATVSTTSSTERCYGIYNRDANATMFDITLEVSGGDVAYGVYNYDASPEMVHVHADASVSLESARSYGVHNQSTSMSYPKMSYVTATASGGEVSDGVYNQYASPFMNNITAIGYSSTGSSYGVYGIASEPLIQYSTLKGETTAVVNGTVRWSVVEGGGSGATCHDSFNEAGIAVQTDCSIVP